MAWVDISENTYKKVHIDKWDHDGIIGSAASNNFYLVLQYDNTACTPTSAKIRFVLKKSKSGSYTDTFHLLVNPTDSTKRSLYELKDDTSGNSWPYYGPAFTVTKTYSASTFTIPAFWSCNDGGHNTTHTATNFYNNYKDSTWRGQNLRCTHAAANIAIYADRTVATNISSGTVSIIDNYNNTFTLKGTKGASGINNPSTGPTLKWGYNTKYSNTFTNGSIITLSASGDTSATRTVYAKSITGAAYGNEQIAFAQLDVRQYVGPGEPGKPVISYSKNRLTVKENWLFNWMLATKTNDSSPVVGYRIRLYRKRGNNDFIKLPIYDSDGKNLSAKAVSSGDIYYDRDGDYPSIYIYPAYYSKDVHSDEPDILPGDQIKLAVTAYTRYGKDNTGNQLFKTSEVASDVSTVQNAGIMRVKIGTWKEGQVYVKVGGTWKEAEVVQTKVNGYWKESE